MFDFAKDCAAFASMVLFVSGMTLFMMAL